MKTLPASTDEIRVPRPGRRRNAYIFGLSVALVILHYIVSYITSRSGVGYMAFVLIGFGTSYAIIFVIFIIAFIASAFRRKAELMRATMIGVSILLSPLILGPSLAEALFHQIDAARFHFVRPHYLAKVDQLRPEVDGSRLGFFNWGSGGFLATNLFYALVFDESRQLELPIEKRSEEWKSAAQSKYSVIISDRCTSTARKLDGDFYILSTTCQ